MGQSSEDKVLGTDLTTDDSCFHEIRLVSADSTLDVDGRRLRPLMTKALVIPCGSRRGERERERDKRKVQRGQGEEQRYFEVRFLATGRRLVRKRCCCCCVEKL